MIQPLLPERLPCYDLSFIAGPSLIPCKHGASAITNFAALTGGVYKRRGRIPRDLLIRDYYQFLVHEGEFQPSIPTGKPFDGISSTLPFHKPFVGSIVGCVLPKT